MAENFKLVPSKDKVINLYGDRLQSDVGRKGANISSQRIDDLDAQCLQYALNLKRSARRNFRSIDLGCGTGIQGVRLSLMGYESHLYDQEPIPEVLQSLRKLYELMRLRYHQGNLAKSKDIKFPTNGVDVCYSQRFIHYLRYNEALVLFMRVAKSMTPGGHVFVSASGLGSEIGLSHPQRNQPIKTRFAKIDHDTARKHSIFEPICVYSPNELKELMEAAGFLHINIWESSFGNIKGVFSKNIRS
jgi:SAM-dependent methyltransferase